MIKKDDIKHIAELARIDLNEDLQDDLSNIIGYIDRLKMLEVSNLLPNYSIMTENITREDVEKSYQDFDKKGEYLKVRQIL